jgi:hypothetical protein
VMDSGNTSLKKTSSCEGTAVIAVIAVMQRSPV